MGRTHSAHGSGISARDTNASERPSGETAKLVPAMVRDEAAAAPGRSYGCAFPLRGMSKRNSAAARGPRRYMAAGSAVASNSSTAAAGSIQESFDRLAGAAAAARP